MKKNRREKIEFIRGYHNDLYKRLLVEVPNIVQDDWIPLQNELDLYNKIIKEYCKDYTDSLQKQLTL